MSATSKTKIAKVMGEFKRGTLRTSAGRRVTSKRQATAIAMSESGKNMHRMMER